MSFLKLETHGKIVIEFELYLDQHSQSCVNTCRFGTKDVGEQSDAPKIGPAD